MTDVIKEPDHYKQCAMEAIDVIEMVVPQYEDPIVGYSIGNALKYVQRAPHKGKQVEDLKKAKQYLSRAIARLEGRNAWD
jgi:hypothetical protein